MKPAREPASSRPKLCASLKNAPRILPVRGSLLTLVERKQTAVRYQLFSQKPEGFNDWGERGYKDFVSGEVTKTAPSRDRIT